MEIKLTFKGQEYAVPESRAFDLGERVEEVVTLAEMASWGRSPRYFKIAKAFGVMLRFAGCKVSDAEVKAELDASIMAAARDNGADEGDVREIFAIKAVEQLQAVLFDGAPSADGESGGPGKTTAS